MVGESRLKHSLRVLQVQLRVSVLVALQYRSNFIVEGLVGAFWTAVSVVPLYLAFEGRPTIAGWNYAEALMVLGFFTLVEGVLKGAISPSLTTVVEHIRQGSLDFVLLKPVDAQFFLSTSRFRPWRMLNVLAACAIFLYAFSLLGRWPTIGAFSASAVLLVAAIVVLYSLWILLVSLAFRVLRIDNIRYLFEALFDLGRFPSSVFKGALAFFFTFVIPLSLMTTYPAEALLDKLPLWRGLAALGASALFAYLSRIVFLRSLATYTSASS